MAILIPDPNKKIEEPKSRWNFFYFVELFKGFRGYKNWRAILKKSSLDLRDSHNRFVTMTFLDPRNFKMKLHIYQDSKDFCTF